MLFSKIENLIRKEKLLKKNDKILVSVSGGPDSIFLLHLLNNFKKKYNLKILVLHINHNLRGKEAKKDEEFVRSVSQKLSLPLIIKSISVSDYQKKHKLSLEEAGRLLRHKVYAQICELKKINKVFLAHTADDQIETILMNFLRGTLIRGLKGMDYQTEFSIKKNNKIVKFIIIRPLLNCFKQEIINFLKENKLDYRIDKSNLDLKFRRNYLRHKIIPLLEKINPAFKENLLKRAEIFSFLEKKIKKKIERIIRNISFPNNRVEISLKQWKKLDEFYRREILFTILEKYFFLKDLNYKQIEDFVNLIKFSPVGKFKFINRDLIIYKDYDKIIISFYNALFKINKISKKEIKIPGEIYIPEIKATVKSQLVKKIAKNNHNKIFLDYNKLNNKLFIRSRKDGDWFIPQGMGERKKIQDYFVDEKIPLYLRNEIPLLVNEKDEIVWIIGRRPDKRFLANKKTKKILLIQFIKKGDI